MSEVVVSLFHVRDERTVQSRIEEAVEDYSRTYKDGRFPSQASIRIRRQALLGKPGGGALYSQ